jgi:antitoxin MazE
MEITLNKWGNSLGIRIPKHLIEKNKLMDGSTLEISEVTDGILIKKKLRLPTIEEIAKSYPKNYTYEEMIPGDLSSEQW